MHIDLSKELQLAGQELTISLELAGVTFLFPVAMLNAFVLSRLQRRSYQITAANIVDLTITAMVIVWLEAFYIYSTNKPEKPLFGEPEDSIYEISLMRGIIDDI